VHAVKGNDQMSRSAEPSGGSAKRPGGAVRARTASIATAVAIAVLASIAFSLVASAPALASCSAGKCTTTIGYKGSVEEWTVPTGVTSVKFVVKGAGGGSAFFDSVGGSGAKVSSTLTVTAGEKLKLVVGGGGSWIFSGGYGGGGQGGENTFEFGAGGGGGSFVFSEAGSPLIAAGGGGGSAGEEDTAGGNGGQTGSAGQAIGPVAPGGGGTASSGGSAGVHATAGSGPTTSTAIQGKGGKGGEEIDAFAGGGGGGGGYYGGGGGGSENPWYAGGGGGGSSTVNGGAETSYVSGGGGTGGSEWDSGQNGEIQVSYSEQSTTTTLHASSKHPDLGSSVTYTATVSPVPTSGTVEFTDGGTAISACSAQTVNTSTGEATCETTYNNPGVHTIEAKYSGSTDTAYAPSASSSETVVATATTTTALAASSEAPAVGTPVEYTATVSPVPNSGTVAFTDGGTAISQCSAQPVNTSTGEATCEVAYGGPGVHTIAAEYSGSTDTSYQSSQSASKQIVATGSTSTTLAASSVSPTIGTPITLTATVSPAPDSGTVAFIDEGAPLPQCEAQPVNTITGEATCEVTYETPDAYVVTAEYSGSTDTSYQSSQSASEEIVARAPTTITLAASSSSPTLGSSVTYTATVTPVPSSGTVSFMEGETVIPGCGEQPVNPSTGQATCEVTYETPGTHSITAQFSGSRQAIFGASTTASVTEITAGAVSPPSPGSEPASTPSAAASTAPAPTTARSTPREMPAPKLRLLRKGAQPLINAHAFDAWVTCGAAPCTVSAKAWVKLPNRSRPLRIVAGASTLAGGQTGAVKLLIPRHLRRLVRRYLVDHPGYHVSIEVTLTTGSGRSAQTVRTTIPIWTFPGFR